MIFFKIKDNWILIFLKEHYKIKMYIISNYL